MWNNENRAREQDEQCAERPTPFEREFHNSNAACELLPPPATIASLPMLLPASEFGKIELR
jgi:hypothetical protein